MSGALIGGDVVRFADNADSVFTSMWTLNVVAELLRRSGNKTCLITQTGRDPYNQARVMFDLIEKRGAAYAHELYAGPGDRVIDLCELSKRSGNARDVVIHDMTGLILKLGATTVSKHCLTDLSKINVIDVDPGGLTLPRRFAAECRAEIRGPSKPEGLIHQMFDPWTEPKDPAIHLEVIQPPAPADAQQVT